MQINFSDQTLYVDLLVHVNVLVDWLPAEREANQNNSISGKRSGSLSGIFNVNPVSPCDQIHR